MCGRLNVIADPLCQEVSNILGICFSTATNKDLRPTQQVSAFYQPQFGFHQIETSWGIKPAWSKKLLINAQAETITEKKTFKHAFTYNRCLVPCSGWYEWKSESSGKQKYLFEHAQKKPLFMAAIAYFNDPKSYAQVVTLTTQPNERCSPYHNRMPVFVLAENINYWFNSQANQLTPLLTALPNNEISIHKC